MKQVVVRTYPKGYTNATTTLQALLDKGYKVVHITKHDQEDLIEYIVEREE